MNFLGIDIGTTSLKAASFNDKLEQLTQATVDYTLEASGVYAEFPAEKYWDITKEGIQKATEGLEIEALSIDTQCETLILTDEDGNPVRKAIVWVDNRADEEAKIIEEHFGRKKVYEITGQPEITATWPASKLLWVKRNEPEVWAKSKKIFLLEDYILYKMTGKFVTEKTLQSSTIYFDINNGIWWKEMLDFIGVETSMLPELYDSGIKIGEYEGMTVVTGAMDQVAGGIGAGIIKQGIISEMTGTTMVLFVPIDNIPPYVENSIIPCHYNYDGKYSLVLWTSVAGMAFKWFKNNFCEDYEDFNALTAIAEKIEPGSNGLTMLPHLCGSTMPKYNPEAKGAFYGITLEHTRAHFARAIMEAISCMLKANLDYINVDANEIRLMGGGAKSSLWNQIKADMTGKTLTTLKNKETACLGSAILAGVGCGYFKSVEEACSMIETDKVFKPSGVDYSKVYENYNNLDNLLNRTL
ncbi:MAG: hypothetical protein J6V03_02470 [Clostridia bacterium]|nr:hypothetical protein [Clostridia bacterium]